VESVVTDRTYVIGTRGSRLALAQTRLVLDALRATHPAARFEVREIATQGDRDAKPLSEIGGQGVFTKAIEDALLRGEIDIAVHSMKDLPPRLAEGLAIAAVPKRGDPRDALVARDGRALAGLPPGARIGTGSARRAVQLKLLRADIECVDIRGNVDTRIRKLDAGQYDAIVVAKAGLDRLDLAHRATQVFSIGEMTPSPGQGALAVQTRALEPARRSLLAALDHEATRAAVEAERAFLEAFGAGCNLPVGAHASEEDGNLVMRSVVWNERAGRLHSREERERMLVGDTTLVDRARRFGAAVARLLIEAAGGSEVRRP
jgi:hydroxymethylbilane synthase